jgi:hypothetical protein
MTPRADAVKAGLRPPPDAARSGLDDGEHGVMLSGSGMTYALARFSVKPQLIVPLPVTPGMSAMM